MAESASQGVYDDAFKPVEVKAASGDDVFPPPPAGAAGNVTAPSTPSDAGNDGGVGDAAGTRAMGVGDVDGGGGARNSQSST